MPNVLIKIKPYGIFSEGDLTYRIKDKRRTAACLKN